MAATSEFYVNNFRVGRYWITAAGIGLFVQATSFLEAYSGWLKCKSLWAERQELRGIGESPTAGELHLVGALR
jgi:hypothetical protein